MKTDKNQTNEQPQGLGSDTAPITAALERHLSVAEVATLWNLSNDAISDIFRHEPGVLVIGNVKPGKRRRYLTLRIPQSVLERVHRQMSLYNQYPKR